MSFGKIIKTLRQNNNLTQEQLANAFNISAQAVSRWETDIALPDISLLPSIANFFDVTTDYLLEVDITKKNEEIKRILTEAREFTTKGCWIQGIEILKEALKKFPTAYSIMIDLSYAILCSTQETQFPLKNEDYDEIIYMAENVLSNSNDTILINSSVQILCLVYGKLQQYKKAEEMAKKMPYMNICREVLLINAFNGKSRYNAVQDCEFNCLNLLLLHLPNNSAPFENGHLPYNDEELILLNKKIIELLNIIFEDKNYGFFAQKIAWTYLNISFFYARLKNENEALYHLKLAAEQAVYNDTTHYNPKTKYTCLIFKDKEYGGFWHNIKSNDSMHQLEEMNDKVYDFIRDTKEFSDIVNKLKQHSNIR